MSKENKSQAAFRAGEHETMHLCLDNGQEFTCDILTIMELEGREYVALAPREMEGEVYVYGFSLDEAGQPVLRNLEEREELDLVLDAFDQWYEQQEEENAPVPVDVFSGFLGAGKTTLIKKLLAEVYKGEKVALIENEFGDVNIDSGFLQDSGVAIREMNAGCICCSLVGDFTKALAKVVDELEPDRILIEPSGVGKLSEIIRAVEEAAGEKIELSSASVVVDASKAKMYMKNFGEFFNDQVEHAGAIILSHTDNMRPEKLEDTIALLRQHNPLAAIVATPWDQLDGAQLMEAVRHTDSLEAELAQLAADSQEQLHWEEEAEEHEHHHEHEHDEHCGCGYEHHHEHEHDEHCGCEHEHHHEHEHDEHCGCEHEHHHEHGHHHHADEVFVSWGVETTHSFGREELEGMLRQLQDAERFGLVLRAKGIVPSEGEWLHFDYVPGEPELRSGSPAVIGRFCVIGSKLQQSALEELFGVQGR